MARPGAAAGRRVSRTSFSAALWTDAADVLRGIEQHRFVCQLRDGTLPRPVFERYVEQDAHYLGGYAVALQACEAQASTVEASRFWAGAARDTVEIETSLQQDYLHGRALPDRSSACAAYVAFLLHTAGAGGGAVLAAAVLPCFWIFSDLGRRWEGIDLTGHPYADWIDTYRDPRFADATAQARAIVDEWAAGSPPAVQALMREAFRSACGYERRLFDDAWAIPDEPVGVPGIAAGRLNGRASARATTNEVTDADSHG